ncbi:membrane-bound O-acyltransferase family protein [Entamoeba histolytica HM-1:IMSS-B]|uniref:Membrane-bound O-acyltransferase (MBOAT ) family protein n=5 Tax=Entamoeba histolytica TaxID=5759 RepID=C4LSW2_ENTH1|nr:membrane-bound O-acyltransferase (MBOAT) family protein [Entamoeba histolytica HM-1:IMSS]EAL50306.1 membrane-bound O-acyltransferase (MBOAT) family protein [Entamoeba histolytica HM-1:IMSS]EMH77571.1 membrane-bound O-acyltransferase family protein [Entamoeba histolytica HM-1:IMSS-B]ENY60281.1 membrane-bound O-acyltransferase domain containing protein [Entamoeba histolytica HM-1:IMSS-A]GAT91532.1 membrane-bound o-acyltransferase mboat family protein [Entamoeba histolytica]|eukprot:XP_655691.1 membrane-bound O-acyltransferase (MBOAT) family protein [Entamoeba histolytica HM-1:IMSS]
MYSIIESFSEKVYVPSDQMRYFLSFFIELPLCYILRYLPSNPRLKHFVYSIIGVIILLFVFGINSMIIIIPGLITYYAMKWKKSLHAAFFIFSLNLMFLTLLQIHKYINYYLQWYLDITTLQMIVVIKLGNFAFNVAKGSNTNTIKQTDYNKMNNIPNDQFPSLLEFIGYFYFFPSIFSGPCIEYQTYKKFVTLELFESYPNNHLKNKIPPIDWKQFFIVFSQGIILLLLTSIVIIVPLKVYFYEIVINNPNDYSFIQKMGMVMIFIYSIVFRYFATWKMAECMGILFGFGYSGVKENKPTWYGFRNVKLNDFFFSNSAKLVIDSWNIYIQTFMKNHIYESFELFGGILNEYKQSLTNLVSAFWHGIYPGYYLSFGMLALHHDVSCGFHSRIEPIIIKKYGKDSLIYYSYLVLTFIYARISISYSFIPFVIYTFSDSWKFFVNTYFCIDIIGLLLLIILYIWFPKQQKRDRID